MNYYALHFAADANLAEEDEVSLLIETEGRHRGRRKTAHCTGVVYKKNVPADPAARARYVVFYRPVSPLNRYIVDQYLLHLSLVY
jgi:hypothetical protein